MERGGKVGQGKRGVGDRDGRRGGGGEEERRNVHLRVYSCKTLLNNLRNIAFWSINVVWGSRKNLQIFRKILQF